MPYSEKPLLWLSEITQSPTLKLRTLAPTAALWLGRVKCQVGCSDHERSLQNPFQNFDAEEL
jgi:hypothetical protein